MSMSATYDGVLSRVRLAVSGLAGPTVTVQRSVDLVRWTTVRGGGNMTVTAGAVAVDDYEFVSDVVNHYRADAQSATITPALTTLWLKSVRLPFLNRTVTVVDHTVPTRPGRDGVHEVVGRTLPVTVSDVRGSRRWSVDVRTEGTTQFNDLDLILSTGDVLYLHGPADCAVATGYVRVGEVSARRTRPRGDTIVLTLPLTESAPPAPDVVGATITWQGVLNTYATWADLLAAHSTWASVLELIGSPGDVIVP